MQKNNIVSSYWRTSLFVIREMKKKAIKTVITALLFISCSNNNNADNESNSNSVNSIPTINYSLIRTFPHDTTSFTEGFLIHDGILYESTGFTKEFPQTRSLFGEVDLTTGKIKPKVELDKTKYFGEGIIFLNGKVYQLTYQTKIGFIYDAKTFKKIGEFTFPSKEGWGMTTDSTYLIMSDGTSVLTYLDSSTLKVIKTVNVADENGPVLNINELEYIKGYIYANIYTTNYIIKIDPDNGRVIGRLDLSSLKNEQKIKFPGSLEMNGIAYNSINDKIYVTGKLWSNIYEIQFSH